MNESEALRAALKWLRDRGGDGVFGKRGVVLARGDWAPFTRATWNALRDCELVEFYGPPGGGGTRLRVTKFGDGFDCGETRKRRSIETLGGPI